MKPDYSYQTPLIEKCYKTLIKSHNVLLAACPGSGKTNMAIRILELMLKRDPKKNVLILCHGQTLLRNQWNYRISKICNLKCTLVDGPIIDTSNRIYIALPHSYRHIVKIPNIDLIIIDEAHHFYKGSMVQMIFKQLKPTYILLLTGTPSTHINNGFEVVGITIDELLDTGVISDPCIQLIKADYNLTLNNYHATTLDLKKSTILNKDDTIVTVNNVIRSLSLRTNIEDIKDLFVHLKKTMFICNNQQQAVIIYDYLTKLGVNALLSISDTTNGELETLKFTTNPKVSLLLVVNRGILGFDYPDLINIVDITQSLNPDRLFQMLCRVIRKDTNNSQKLFLKICTPELSKVTFFVMSYVVALSNKEYYYSKHTINETRIPFKTDVKTILTKSTTRSETRKFPSLPDVSSFREFKNTANDNTLAMTTFKEVRQNLYSVFTTTLDESLSFLNNCSSRYEFRTKHSQFYAWMQKRNYAHLIDKKFPKKQYSLKVILKLAKNYKKVNDFRFHHPNEFRFMRQQGKYHLLHKAMKIKPCVRWTLETALAALKKCNSREIFQRKYAGASEFLIRNHKELLDQHKPPLKRAKWTEDKIKEAANRCKTKYEFSQRYNGAYMRARITGLKISYKNGKVIFNEV